MQKTAIAKLYFIVFLKCLFFSQDLIQTAKSQTQQEIQLAVHRVYEALINSLVRIHHSSSQAFSKLHYVNYVLLTALVLTLMSTSH